MLRERLLHPRRVVRLLIAWGVVLAALPHPGEAAPLSPWPAAEAAGDPDTAGARLEETRIRERLVALGVSPAEAAALIERLSADERTELAARTAELDAGGNALVAISAAVIVGLLVVLILELMGRRVISRP